MNTQNIYYVYCYYDTRTEPHSPIYIGKGKHQRWVSHLSYTDNQLLRYKLKNILEETGKPAKVVKLHENLTNEESCAKEIEYISLYGRICNDTGTLCNFSTGGEHGSLGVKLTGQALLDKDLNLIEPILKALQTEGYTTPTPIQEQSIPTILQKRDLLGCAQTGTGKTAAFAIPMIQLLAEDLVSGKPTKAPKALILTPTRELAIQIMESFAAYGRHIPLKRTVIFGGVNQHGQVMALQKGIDILIATPGRLLDLMNQGYVDFRSIQIFVLDEADRMLDMGFVNDVKKIIAKLPIKRQTLFFSATMPNEIQSLANTILTNPKKVEVTPVSSTAETIDQSVFFVDKKNKNALLIHLLKNKEIKRVLVFTRTKHGADKVVKVLEAAGVKSAAIHGNKSQNARQNALQNFKNSVIRVLTSSNCVPTSLRRADSYTLTTLPNGLRLILTPLADRYSVTAAFYVAGAFLMRFLPETKGQELT